MTGLVRVAPVRAPMRWREQAACDAPDLRRTVAYSSRVRKTGPVVATASHGKGQRAPRACLGLLPGQTASSRPVVGTTHGRSPRRLPIVSLLTVNAILIYLAG